MRSDVGPLASPAKDLYHSLRDAMKSPFKEEFWKVACAEVETLKGMDDWEVIYCTDKMNALQCMYCPGFRIVLGSVIYPISIANYPSLSQPYTAVLPNPRRTLLSSHANHPHWEPPVPGARANVSVPLGCSVSRTHITSLPVMSPTPPMVPCLPFGGTA